MSRFNKPSVKATVRSPVTSETVPSGFTHEGAPGYARDSKSELFLLAVSYMGSDDTFYETGKARDTRFASLVRTVAVGDPAWMAGFIPWLRNGANMRTASLVAAAEAVKARLDAACPGPPHSGHASSDWTCPRQDGIAASNRQVIASALQRADEPGELLAYWHSLYGRNEPKPVKRGIADAIIRLYTEFSLLKYDTGSHGYRFGDVIERVHVTGEHPEVKGTWRGELYEHAIDRRHGRDNDVPEVLAMIRANATLRAMAAGDPRALLSADALRAAGMTWEDALSLAGPRVAKRDLWTALIPSMGYMALLRNLRNFDDAGVPDEVAGAVIARLADPEQVARSRQFPFRFLSAYRAVPSLRWGYPLERALDLSLVNVPKLKGRTLILVDTSASMNDAFSKDGTLMRWDAAALFGVALGHRCDHADVVSFSGRNYYHEAHVARTMPFPLVRGESMLRSLDRWKNGGWFLGGGTDTALALRAHFAGHDRVVITTDEQAARDGLEVSDSIPPSVPLYTWNLAGYKHGHGPSGTGNRYVFGGLTDTAFCMIPALEAGQDARWPWM
jgi:TROVE domain